MSLHAHIALRRGRFSLDVSLEVEPGETLAIVGPNGSGKSTLLAALAGLLPEAEARVSLGGRVLDDASTSVPSRRRRIGVVFQDLLLFPHLSARENVAFGPRCAGVSRGEARARADVWLDRLGLAGDASAPARSLSGGQAQRVALARALASEPELLLLDEPLAALDLHARAAARRLLSHTLGAFAGVRLLVTHEPLDALALADRILILEEGAVVQTGAPDEIRANPRSAYAASLVGVNAWPGAVRVEQGHTFIDTLDGGAVAVPADGLVHGQPVFACVHPHSVILSPDQPVSSARNMLRAGVRSVSDAGDRLRVRLDSTPPITAEITPESAAALAVHPGATLWASFKATDVTTHPR